MVNKSTKFLKRLVFSYTVVFGILMAIILLFATFIMIRYNDKNKALDYKVLINQPLKELESTLNVIDDTAFRVMGNADIINKFTFLQTKDDEENYFDTNILDNIDVGSVLYNINGINNPNWRVSVYNDKYDFISTGALTNKEAVQNNLKVIDVKGKMDFFNNEKKNFCLQPPNDDKWSNNSLSEYFSITRQIKNVYSKTDIVGLVEVQNSVSVILNAVDFGEDINLYVNVYDEKGKPIVIQNSEDTVVSEVVSDKYNWTVQLVADKSIRQMDILKIIISMSVLWILITVTMYLVIEPIISNITKPLTELTEYLAELNPTIPAKIPHINTEIVEINSLESAFNKVLEERTLAMKCEKEAYLMALQSQINPHFIFNVLSVINAAAIEENYESVMSTCLELSKMLRYSSSYDASYITFEEEINYTKAYLKLMKARYEHMFDYTIEVDSNLLSIEVPKLIIQPLCENCFMHAFNDIEPPYKIKVVLSEMKNGFSLKVIDNGLGFSKSKKAEILKKLNEYTEVDLSDTKIGGLGLLSTVIRVKLFTKQKVICEIYKNGNETVVELIVNNEISEEKT